MKHMCPVCDRPMPKEHSDEAEDKKLFKKMIKKEEGKMSKKMKRGK